LSAPQASGKPSSLLDTRVIYCGDNLEQLRKLPDACVDLIYIDPPFNSNRNYEYAIRVKQKDKAGRPDIDAFEAVMTREERTKGFFVAFDCSQDALDEIGRFFKQTGRVIVALTVKEILDEQIAMKLA
jgi:DNA modification methylase